MKWKVAGALVVVLTLAALAVGGRWWLVQRSSPEHFAKRAQAFAAQGQTDQALEEYKRALWAAKNGKLMVPLMLAMADAAMASPPAPGDKALLRFFTAMDLWRQVLDRQPDQRPVADRLLQARFDCARADASTASWQQARDAAERVLKLDGKHPLALACRATAGLNLLTAAKGDADAMLGAQDALRTAIAANPDDPELVYCLALALLRQAVLVKSATPADPRTGELCKQARETMEAFTSQHPGNLKARLNTALVLLQQAGILDDRAALDQARALLQVPAADLAAEADPEVRLAFARMQGDIGLAPPGTADTKAPRAAALLRAETEIRAVVAAAPDRPEGLLALADNLAAQGKLTAASELYDRLRAEQTVPVGIAALRAQRAQGMALLGQASLLFRRLEEDLAPADRQAVLAGVRQTAQDMEKRARGRSVPLDLLEAKLAYHEGRFREAANQIEAVHERLGSPDPEALLTAGLALAKAGETGAALDRFGQYRRNPGRTPEGSRRADMETARLALLLMPTLNQDQFTWTLDRTERLLEESPTDPAVVLLRCRALMNDALRRSASLDAKAFVATLTQLLVPLVQAGNTEAVGLLAQVHVQARDTEAARLLLAQQIEKAPGDGATLVALLQLEQAAKHTDRVRELLTGVAQREPPNPASQLLSAELQKPEPSPARLARLAQLALEADAFEREIGLQALHRIEGQPQAAEDALARAAALAPGSSRLWHIRIGQAMFVDRDSARAEGLLAEAGACGISAFETEYWRAANELTQKQVSAAQRRLEELLTKCPLYSDARVALGDAYMENGQAPQAEAQYKEALKLNPDRQDALLRLFRLYDQRGKYELAINFLRNALLLTPSDALMAQFLAYAERYDKPTALAIRERMAADSPDPDNRRAMVRLFAELEKPKEADQVLDALIAEEGRTAANVLTAARLARQSQRGDEGRLLLQEHLRSLGAKAGPNDWLAYARFLGEVGHADTVSAYERAIELAPPDAGALPRELAQYYVSRGQRGQPGQYEKALAMFRESMRREPRPDTWRQVVGTLISLQRYQEAAQELTALKKQYEVDLRVALLDAGTALGQGDYPAALKSAEQAVSLAPAAPEARLARAQVYMSSPDVEVRLKAKADLDQVLERVPDSVPARDLLARWLLQNGSLDQAIVQLQRLVEQQPGFLDFRVRLGGLYLAAGRYAVLDEQLRQWTAQAPTADEWLWLRGNLLLAQGKAEAASRELASYFGKQKTPAVLELYARALLSSGQAPRALEVLDANLALVSASPALLGARAVALIGLGRQADGLAAFALAIGKIETATPAADVQALANHVRAALTPEDAEPLYRAIKERAANPEVWLQWINTLSQLGRTDDMADQLKQYLQANPPSGRTALLEADLAAQRRDPAAALAAVERAVVFSPKDAGVYLFRARLRSADPSTSAQDQVKRDLDQALALAPDLLPAQEMLVDWLIRRGRPIEAIGELRRLTKGNPAALNHKRRLAQLLLDSADLSGLEKALAEWEKASPDAADLHQIRGWLERARSNWAPAVAEFAACYAKQPSAQVLYEYADTLLRDGKAAPALDLLTRNAARVDPSPALMSLRARALAATGAQAEAAKLLESAFALAATQRTDPSAIVAAAREVVPGAGLATLLDQAAKNDPTGQVRWNQARICLGQGDTAGAIRLLEALKSEAQKETGPSLAVLLALASAYSQSGAHDQAQATLRVGLAGRPDDPTLLNALAYELTDIPGKVGAALALARSAVLLAEGAPASLPHYLDTLGYAQFQAKQYPEARASLERAQALKDFAACRIHLAQVALAQKDTDAARKHLEAAKLLAEKAGDTKAVEQIKQLTDQLPQPAPAP